MVVLNMVPAYQVLPNPKTTRRDCFLLFMLCCAGVLDVRRCGVGIFVVSGFQGSALAWVIVLGSLMVVLNMVPAYQVPPNPNICGFESLYA
jgi:hypothetical protein